jgi:hypothetical protein
MFSLPGDSFFAFQPSDSFRKAEFGRIETIFDGLPTELIAGNRLFSVG